MKLHDKDHLLRKVYDGSSAGERWRGLTKTVKLHNPNAELKEKHVPELRRTIIYL